MNFKNDALPAPKNKDRSGSYGFTAAPTLLFFVSHFFQAVISQAGTFLLTGRFHDKQCSIYKAEGGCNIPGVGDLVLGAENCRFDAAHSPKRHALDEKMADLITAVVLAWDPNLPTDSMLQAAAKYIKAPLVDLEKAINIDGGPFAGDALSTFFSWNPFSEAPDNREYRKYLATKFGGQSKSEVDQRFADEDMGKDLLKRLREAVRKADPHSLSNHIFCCSPKRFQDGSLHFWVNTGRSTQIDGWKIQKDLEAFIKSGKNLEYKR